METCLNGSLVVNWNVHWGRVGGKERDGLTFSTGAVSVGWSVIIGASWTQHRQILNSPDKAATQMRRRYRRNTERRKSEKKKKKKVIYSLSLRGQRSAE
jgi:hypothetical protein